MNAVLKTSLYTLRNEQEARQVAAAAIKSYSVYIPPSKLSEIKEHFFDNLTIVLKDLQTPEKMKSISDHSWKDDLFESCFDPTFQRDRVNLVFEDNEGKYFSSGNINPVLTKDRRKIL